MTATARRSASSPGRASRSPTPPAPRAAARRRSTSGCRVRAVASRARSTTRPLPPSSFRRGSDMDPVLDRVRAADPVRPGEFAGLADFDALVLDPPPPPRRRRRLLALPAPRRRARRRRARPVLGAAGARDRPPRQRRRRRPARASSTPSRRAENRARRRHRRLLRHAPRLGPRHGGHALARGQRRRGGLRQGRRERRASIPRPARPHASPTSRWCPTTSSARASC